MGNAGSNLSHAMIGEKFMTILPECMPSMGARLLLRNSAFLVLTVVVTIPSLLSQEFDPSSTGRMAIDERGRKIVLASKDKNVRVWNLDTKQLLHTIDLGEPALSVALSQNGDELLTGTIGDRPNANERTRSTIKCWNIQGESPLLLWETPVIGGCQGLAFSKSNDWVVGICVYSRLVFLDRKTGKLRRVWTEEGNGFWQMALPHDERYLITAGQATRVWDLTSNPIPNHDLPFDYWPGNNESQNAQPWEAFSGGSSVSSSRTSNSAYVLGFFHGTSGRAWDVARIDFGQGRNINVIATELGASDGKLPSCIALSPDGLSYLAIGFEGGILEIRKTDGTLLRKTRFDIAGNIRSVSFVDRGEKVAVAYEGGVELFVIDTNDLSNVERFYR